MNKKFPLNQVLSITTGILLGSMSDVYEILDYMTGDNLFTHQLPRACQSCGPAILEQHPVLKDVDASDFQKEHWREWLDKQCTLFPAEYEIVPLSEWESRHPVEEFGEMVGDKKIIQVKI
jgi:hypothetical protein